MEKELNVAPGWISAGMTFIAAWIYCTATYGFLFGFGLGWIPSAILAAIVGIAMVFLWKPALILVVLLLLYMCSQS
jgi:hypothetical protein